MILRDLLDANSSTSSKRAMALWAMLLLTVIVICALLGNTVPEALIYALVSIILGQSAMTLKSSTQNVDINKKDTWNPQVKKNVDDFDDGPLVDGSNEGTIIP